MCDAIGAMGFQPVEMPGAQRVAVGLIGNDRRVDGSLISDVRHSRGAADLVGQGVDAVRPTAHANHVEAKSSKGFRGRFADAGAGAGDHCHPLRGFVCRHSANFSWRAKFSVCPLVRLPAAPFGARVVVVALIAAPD